MSSRQFHWLVDHRIVNDRIEADRAYRKDPSNPPIALATPAHVRIAALIIRLERAAMDDMAAAGSSSILADEANCVAFELRDLLKDTQ